MTEFLQMHIFFFVTTVAVLGLGALLALILVRVYRILSDVEHISHHMSEESDLIRSDIRDMRARVRVEGFKMKYLSALFRSTLGRFMRKKKKHP